LRDNDSLGEGINRNITGKKLRQDGPKDEDSGAFKRFLVHDDPDLQPARERQRASSGYPPDDRSRDYRTNAVNLTQRKDVVRVYVNLQEITQGNRTILLCTSSER
jgi:hypothetical protein